MFAAGVVRKDGDDLAFAATFGHVPSLGRGERSEHGSRLRVSDFPLPFLAKASKSAVHDKA
jgi:hypothetical protein